MIDTGDARLLNAVFRGGYLYTAHTITHNSMAALRLYKIAVSGKVAQQVTYGNNFAHYFYPAICPDSRGNIVVVFSRSARNEFPGARFTGRRSTDTSYAPSLPLKPGAANYEKLDNLGRNRWGDYNGIALDPSDDSVWIFSEFAVSGDKWATRAAKVKFN
jgi:hypothetical protein